MVKTNLQVQPLPLDGALLIRPAIFEDSRGQFAVPYNRDAFYDAGISADFTQDNQSLSRDAGTVRGLHAQRPPFEQAKLVRVAQGHILDVIVDARVGSRTYGQHCATELTAAQGEQIFVPRGFLHGFVTREPDTTVIYKVDGAYAPDAEVTILWNDPALGIDWGLQHLAPILSPKDKQGVLWAQFQSQP